jgi:hypothetical protein
VNKGQCRATKDPQSRERSGEFSAVCNFMWLAIIMQIPEEILVAIHREPPCAYMVGWLSYGLQLDMS